VTKEYENPVDHHVLRVFELLTHKGWVTRTMRAGERSILSSVPRSAGWNGVHVHFSGEELLIYCSGKTAKTYEPSFSLLQREPSRIADMLVQIAEHHQLDELAASHCPG
jgi:hypothetical protein